MQEIGHKSVCFGRNVSNLSMLTVDSFSSQDILFQDAMSQGARSSEYKIPDDARTCEGRRPQVSRSCEDRRPQPSLPSENERTRAASLLEGHRSEVNGYSEVQRSRASRSIGAESSLGYNDFLMVFDNASGKNNVAYFLIENSGSRKRILPKQNMMVMSKVNDMTGYNVVVMDNYLYLIGGKHIMGSVLSYCYRFNPNNNQWRPLANMNVARARHTATVLDGAIYVCGGETRNGLFTDSVERFDPRTDSWTQMRSMCSTRADHAAVAAQGKLFVSGGVSDRSGANVNFWQYDPVTDFWTQASRRTMLLKPKERHTMVHHRNKLYCVGGITIDRFLDDMEDATLVSFDCSRHNVGPKIEGMWDRSYPDMDRPRCRGDAVVIGHYIYHIGGHNYSEGRPEPVVEHYNIHRKRWQHGFRLTGDGYSSVRCCVVRVPTTNRHFSTLGLAMSNRWIMW